MLRCGLILALLASPAHAATAVTANVYARAERFLSWNKDQYVINADIQHHWIADTERFWYERTNEAGQKETVIVDAVSGKTRVTPDRKGLTEAGPSEGSSPDGKWIAFVKDFNVWIRVVADGTEFPLTKDGIERHGYASLPASSNYVRRIRHLTPSVPQVAWSPDSRFLFTYRLDERRVKDAFLIQSVPEDGSFRPKLYRFPVAFAGDEHLPMLEPVVLEPATRRVTPLKTDPLYCPTISWIDKRNAWWSQDSKTVYYLDRDRYARRVALDRTDVATGQVTEVLRETSHATFLTSTDNIFDFPVARTLGNGDVIWYSARDGWSHLYYYDAVGHLRRQITRGPWVVRGIVRVDESDRRIYFLASGREVSRDPYEEHLYRVHFDGSDLRLLTPEPAHHEPRFLSQASLGSMPSDSQIKEKSAFSPSGRFFIDSCSRPDLPPVLVLRASDGRLIRKLEEADISKLRGGGYQPIEPFEALAADGKTKIYGNLFRPSDFDPSRHYPVIDSIYSVPTAIRTAKRFTTALFDYFQAQTLAELGFIVVTIDGRGTPGRSAEFLAYSYGHLDRASDLDDHIAAIRQLARRYPYMDLARVGADGASGGGYGTARALLGYPEFYKVGVAAEGNHEARAYNASWGDTLIGALDEGDYPGSSNLPLAGNLKGHLLLMQGELDDNVSPTLTLKLADALIKANKDFDLLIIPNEDHAAFATSGYFIRREWDYFIRNLMGAAPPADYQISRPH